MRWLAVLLLASGATASAEPAEDWDFCRNGLFPEEPPFAHAQVTGQGQLRFLEDMDGCLDKGATCPARGYVIPGDRVLTSKVHGAYTCAFYPGRGGGTAGWVETARLRPLPVERAPRAEAWVGQWSTEGDNGVTIHRRGEAFEIDGEAYWPSANPPIEERPGGPNIGSIGGMLRVEGNRAEYDEGEGCQVSFTLIGELLIAGDNHQCGGMNVSFSGVYKRTGRRP